MQREADFLYIPALRNQEIGMLHAAQQREVAVPQRGLTSHPLLGRDALFLLCLVSRLSY